VPDLQAQLVLVDRQVRQPMAVVVIRLPEPLNVLLHCQQLEDRPTVVPQILGRRQRY
jgi:hypothetical protein